MVNKNIYDESNSRFIFLQELVKKMKTIILKFLLCPDLYLSKLSQLTLIFQKGSLVRKNFHSTHVGMNIFHGCIMILKKMSCCVEHVFLKRKKQLSSIIQKGSCFSFNWLFELEKNLGKVKETQKFALPFRSINYFSHLRDTRRHWRNVQ